MESRVLREASWVRRQRALTQSGLHSPVSRLDRAISPSLAGRITVNGRVCWWSTTRADTFFQGNSHPFASPADRPAWCWARLAHSSSWKRAATPRRAEQSRWLVFSACYLIVLADLIPPSAPLWHRCGKGWLQCDQPVSPPSYPEPRGPSRLR